MAKGVNALSHMVAPVSSVVFDPSTNAALIPNVENSIQTLKRTMVNLASSYMI